MNSIRFIEFPSVPDITNYAPTIINGISAFLSYHKQIIQSVKLIVGLSVLTIFLSTLFIPGLLSVIFGKLGVEKLQLYFLKKAQESSAARFLRLIWEEYHKILARKKGQLAQVGIF